jgi:hypothetical protein
MTRSIIPEYSEIVRMYYADTKHEKSGTSIIYSSGTAVHLRDMWRA